MAVSLRRRKYAWVLYMLLKVVICRWDPVLQLVRLDTILIASGQPQIAGAVPLQRSPLGLGEPSIDGRMTRVLSPDSICNLFYVAQSKWTI